MGLIFVRESMLYLAGVKRLIGMQAEEPYGENKVSVCGAPSPVSIIKCKVAR